ncbi:HET-domain-containing protein, partial [Coniophora puteana RWD-64-598 SS2]
MQDCLRTHDCPALQDALPFLPTRVIDCSDPSHPRLFVSGHAPGRYIALSYVWGEPQPYSTTSSNIASYVQHIDTQFLPQTIKDAIIITNMLGIRYLWADTLCIIQDSDEDKVHELGHMKNIYRDSYLTIVVASANRVSEGFLHRREDTLRLNRADFTLPVVLPEGRGTGSVSFSPMYMEIDNPVTMDDTWYEPLKEPVHQRAWCMQELFLSPRSLVFASHTLQYQCQKGARNIGGADNEYWTDDRIPWSRPPPISGIPQDVKTIDDLDNIYGAWKTIVHSYTRRSISVPGDKLVALAALAEYFHAIVQAPYLAGVWQNTLLMDLLWAHVHTTGPWPRPSKYRAPSWSWTAIDGLVAYYDGCAKGCLVSVAPKTMHAFVAQVVLCETALQDATLPFGAVSGGVLVLR